MSMGQLLSVAMIFASMVVFAVLKDRSRRAWLYVELDNMVILIVFYVSNISKSSESFAVKWF
jgi:hypothetical protein